MENLKRKKGKGKGKLKGLIKKAGQGIKRGAKTAVLIPFKPAMQIALKRKGLNSKGSLEEVAKRFYSEILKKGNFEEAGSENLIDDLTEVIIKAIVAFFKNAKKKKDAGEKLSEVEEGAAKAAESIVEEEKNIQEEEEEAEEGKGKGKGKPIKLPLVGKVSQNTLIFSGVALVALIFIIYKLRK